MLGFSKRHEKQRPLLKDELLQLTAAPLLHNIISNIDPEQRLFVIDLGGVSKGKLDMFTGLRIRIDVFDLDVEAFRMEDSEATAQAFKLQLRERIPSSGGEQVGLVLCWNLLNYLKPYEIEELMKALTSRFSPDVLIHALIESSATQMPGIPEPLSLNSDGNVGFLTISGAESARVCVPAPRYSTDELVSSMPGLIADQTVLLGNGKKEYLFRTAGA